MICKNEIIAIILRYIAVAVYCAIIFWFPILCVVISHYLKGDDICIFYNSHFG